MEPGTLAKGRRCVVCDKPTPKMADRCTNQCCIVCHTKHCTRGGATAPGHGINIPAARRYQWRALASALAAFSTDAMAHGAGVHSHADLLMLAVLVALAVWVALKGRP